MEVIQKASEWKEMVDPALESKAGEFHLMGYEKATGEDIWKCLVQKVWKRDPDMRLYEVVSDIFHLSTNIYLSYLTVNAYKDDDLMASIAALTGEDAREN
ncbi:post-transcriptional regulator [Virgibacillus sediminis]|uniref:Post-transcriptional regulator n=1 Tax=Virgibacillus sediminis TaxID=202260 RepID=A0ABV7A5V3_9BACI